MKSSTNSAIRWPSAPSDVSPSSSSSSSSELLELLELLLLEPLLPPLAAGEGGCTGLRRRAPALILDA